MCFSLVNKRFTLLLDSFKGKYDILNLEIKRKNLKTKKARHKEKSLFINLEVI